MHLIKRIISGRFFIKRSNIACLIVFLMLSMCGLSITACGTQGIPDSDKMESESDAKEQLAAQYSVNADKRSGQKKITVMLYLCGSDLESQNGSATKDLTEILESGFNANYVNVIVMAGGTTKWQNDFSQNETAIYEAIPPKVSLESFIYEDRSNYSSRIFSDEGKIDSVSATISRPSDAINSLIKDKQNNSSNYSIFGSSPAEQKSEDGDISYDDKPHWKKVKAFSSTMHKEAPANMGESDTLKTFLNYGYENYPAEEYALIMWDHGGGPLRGLCFDSAWAKDSLSMEEVVGALKDSPFSQENLAWIGMDACLMSSIETAHLIAPYAKYMIASEETEPSLGWSYDFLRDIEKDTDGAETGQRIIESYYSTCQAENKEIPLTLSCTDLSALKDTEAKMDAFFGKLSLNLHPETFSELSNLRKDTLEFGKAMSDSQYLDLVDLGDLIDHYEAQAPKEAAALEESLKKTVIYTKSNIDGCTGLSAYHPYHNKTYYEKVWNRIYNNFNFAPSYTGYINDFASIWQSDALGDWSQMSKVSKADLTEDIQYFSIQLTPEQMQYYASSQLLILKEWQTTDGSKHYVRAYMSNDTTMQDDGTLRAGYNNRCLYIIGDNGEILGGPLGYGLSDDNKIRVFANYRSEESGAEQSSIFEFENDTTAEELPILQQYVYDENGFLSNRLQIRQEMYQDVYLWELVKDVTYEGDRILPFTEWNSARILSGYHIELPADFHFQFLDHNAGDEAYYACFQVYDTQGNAYGTEMVPVKNPNQSKLTFKTEDTDNQVSEENGNVSSDNHTLTSVSDFCIAEDDYVRITVSGHLNTSDYSKGMELRFSIENLTEHSLSFPAASSRSLFLSDETDTYCIPEAVPYCSDLQPGEKKEYSRKYDRWNLGDLDRVREMYFSLDYQIKEEDASKDRPLNTITLNAYPDNMNLNDISALDKDDQGLATVQQDQIQWTLFSIINEPDSRLSTYDDIIIDAFKNRAVAVFVRCKNTGKEPIKIPFPRYAAINNLVLENLSVETPVLDPGMECCFVMQLLNRQYYIGIYSHLRGIQHLVLKDSLKNAGISSIESLTLYFYGDTYIGDLSKRNQDNRYIRFDFSSPITLTKGNKAADWSESFYDESVQDEMTKALDEGDTMPTRIKLFSQDGINIYGEHILIADREFVISVILENETDEDVYLQYGNWSLNQRARTNPYSESLVAFASSQRRVYLDHEFRRDDTETADSYDTSQSVDPDRILDQYMTTDSVSTISMCLWLTKTDSGDSLPEVHEITFTLPEDTAFNLDGGISFPVSTAHPTDFCQTDNRPKDWSVFDAKVTCPKNLDNYQQNLVFQLPDMLTADQRSSIVNVTAFITKDYTETENAKYPDKELGVARQLLSSVQLEKDPDTPGKYIGNYSGLICTPEEYGSFVIPTIESFDEYGKRLLTSGVKSSYYTGKNGLMPDPAICADNSLQGYEFQITLNDDYSQSSAVINEFRLETPSEYDNYKGLSEKMMMYSWPASWFKSLSIENQGNFYNVTKDGALKSSAYFFKINKEEIAIEKKAIRLQLIPATEYAPDFVVMYQVEFSDNSRLYFEEKLY